MYEKNRILKIKKDTPLQKNKKQNKNKAAIKNTNVHKN